MSNIIGQSSKFLLRLNDDANERLAANMILDRLVSEIEQHELRLDHFQRDFISTLTASRLLDILVILSSRNYEKFTREVTPPASDLKLSSTDD